SMTRAHALPWLVSMAALVASVDVRAQAQEQPQEPAVEQPASEESAAEERADDDPSVDRYRLPVDQLAEHFLGSTARPVRFDWRRSPVMLAVHGSELIERNNFGSFRLGGLVRKAFDSWLLEGGASWVFVSPTE